MNKVTTFTLAAVLVLVSGLAYAHEQGQEKQEMMGMMKHGMMMNMTRKDMIATSDGGVVIIIGNKIIKYDRNLKLVNQADLPQAEDMSKMMKECPMMKKSKKCCGKDKGKDKEGDDDDEAGEAAAKPADAVDHASHHQ